MTRLLLCSLLIVVATAPTAGCGPADPRQESDRVGAEASLERGWAAHEAGDWRAAERAYHEAARSDPSFAWTYYRLGVLAANIRLHGAAEAHYRRAIALDPGFMPPHYELGVLHAAAGDYESAAALLQHAVDLVPRDPQARLQLGLVYAALGRDAEAAAQLAAARLLAAPATGVLASAAPTEIP